MSEEVKLIYTDNIDLKNEIIATSFYIDRTKKWQKNKFDKNRKNKEERENV